MKETPDKNVIIQRLKQYYGLSTNTELANKLGVAQNTISGWIKRNSIDYDLIISKCEDVDFNWLLSGATTSHKRYRSISDIEDDKRLRKFTKGRKITSLSQALKEDEAENNLLDYCHRRYGSEKFYDDDVYSDIRTIYSIIQDFDLKNLFSQIYNKFKISKDEKALFHAYNELYAECLEFYLLLKPYREEIFEISESLLDYLEKKEFKPMLDGYDEKDNERDKKPESDTNL